MLLVKFEGEKKTTNASNKDNLNDKLPDKNIAVGGGNGSNIEATLEQNKDSDKKYDIESTHNNTEEKANEHSGEKANEFKRSNGNHYVEVILDEGNNNVGNNEGAKKKDSVRRARFSSEITIQPKAYFESGTETVIMMVRTYI